MHANACSVLLYGQDSAFFDYASIQLAAHGIAIVPALTERSLVESLRRDRPRLVLLHWDTLGAATLRSCAQLKQLRSDWSAPVAIVSEKLNGGVNIVSAFSSGADDLIEGALNPRIFWSRVRSLLGLNAAFTSPG